ncbi:MAG: hypothetical protein H0W74_14270 [Sphingosinicella sp.]|nr:hypothetical protein [Sphingosinicella sp.]
MLLNLLLIAIVVGAVLYVLNRLPIDATIKMLVTVVAVVVLAIYALKLIWPMAGLS